MSNLLEIGLMVLSALLVAVADSLIKKVSGSGTLTHSLISPPMLIAYALYFVQIVIAVYVFKKGIELGIYANLYIVFYSLLGVLSGILIFNEKISLVQGIGIVFALTGAVLLNIH